jgi:hypothetical protein
MHSWPHDPLFRLLTLALFSWLLTGAALLTGESDQRTPRTIRVGKGYPVKTIAAASKLARNGDTVEITAGEYIGDIAVWTQANLSIRGVNGRPRLIAAGKAAEDKAIWVIRGKNIVIENIEFTGAKVPSRNGAGIRFERGKLTVRNCVFVDNENGMLVGNDPATILEIEDSEFYNNGAGDGSSHNLYVGTIQRFSVQGSYFHHARVGHLLKTRAKENFVYYNRLTDEPGGQASYELEFPVGGVAVVVGNLIEQGEKTENPTIISYGAEGYSWLQNNLYLSYNTIVNDRTNGGIFIAAREGSASVTCLNNILVGDGHLEIGSRTNICENWRMDRSEFARPNEFDFRLKAGSQFVGVASDAQLIATLRPTKQYMYPVGTVPLSGVLSFNPGAFQSVAIIEEPARNP